MYSNKHSNLELIVLTKLLVNPTITNEFNPMFLEIIRLLIVPHEGENDYVNRK